MRGPLGFTGSPLPPGCWSFTWNSDHLVNHGRTMMMAVMGNCCCHYTTGRQCSFIHKTNHIWPMSYALISCEPDCPSSLLLPPPLRPSGPALNLLFLVLLLLEPNRTTLSLSLWFPFSLIMNISNFNLSNYFAHSLCCSIVSGLNGQHCSTTTAATESNNPR